MHTLLDTAVLAELLRAEPAPALLAWFATQPAESLFVSTLTQAELMLAVRQLAPGAQRDAVQAALQMVFASDFADRVLPFDGAAMADYADIAGNRLACGRPMAALDAQIAAIARRAGARLATRHVADFEGCGLALVNPWDTTLNI